MPVWKKIRLAMPAWETGRLKSGFGAKAGGLGSVLEELPEELVKSAADRGIKLEIEILAPCFAHYDRTKLSEDPEPVPVKLDGGRFDFTVYRRKIDEHISTVYFWDEVQLGWTTPLSLYPHDPEMGFKLYATVSQAMAGYIRRNSFHTVHSHDYHLGIIPFYLGRDYLQKVPHHLTIHNATYQGVFPPGDSGPEQLDRIGLPGGELYDQYFSMNGVINFLHASALITHETGGRVTTVSGDLQASWGYAAELMLNYEEILAKAKELNGGREVRNVFVPNCGLDEFREIGVAGITNGLSEVNRAENLPELKASVLREHKEKLGGKPVFCDPEVERTLLEKDHSFGPGSLETKGELKRLLHRELFGSDPENDVIFLVSVGRLTAQKNFEVIAATAERVMESFPSVKYAIIANPPEGEPEARELQGRFLDLKKRHPESFFYTHVFSEPHSRLILAGGDFALIPSRFEPCGLVDYEASALGTIVIGHNTGGLSKVAKCAYLYDWLDSGDPRGEEDAFFSVIKEAVLTWHDNPGRHRRIVKAAMRLDSGWRKSADQYLDLYLYGLIYRAWQAKKEVIARQVDRYAVKLFAMHPLFLDFYRVNSTDILEQRMNSLVSRARENTGQEE